MFVVLSPRGRAILLLYVDDIKHTGDYSVTISLIKCRALYLSSLTLSPKYFLVLEVAHSPRGWYLRSNNVITLSKELNSMMRRLLTLPWSLT